MPRETVRDKGTRYLIEGRVVIKEVNRHGVEARVRGDGGVYRTEWTAGAWTCTCPHSARTTDCSHIVAVKRVVAVDLRDEARR